jgi:hypothetical protein
VELDPYSLSYRVRIHAERRIVLKEKRSLAEYGILSLKKIRFRIATFKVDPVKIMESEYITTQDKKMTTNLE